MSESEEEPPNLTLNPTEQEPEEGEYIEEYHYGDGAGTTTEYPFRGGFGRGRPPPEMLEPSQEITYLGVNNSHSNSELYQEGYQNIQVFQEGQFSSHGESDEAFLKQE